MKYFGISDVGLVREKNQDSFSCIKNDFDDFIAVICDGVGACKNSEIASKLITDTLKDSLLSNKASLINKDDIINYLDDILGKLNINLYKRSKEEGNKHLSSTIAGIYINSNNDKILFSAGDSRIYGIKTNKLVQLSKDDTLIEKLVNEGKITKEDALYNPNKNIITNACGIGKTFTINYKIIKNQYDYYLLSSDGFYKNINEKDIIPILNKDITIYDKVKELISLSLLKGGDDNISLIVIDNHD